MKKIILNVATPSNAGQRLAAGMIVGVGPGDDEISVERAKALRLTGGSDDAPAEADVGTMVEEYDPAAANIAQDKAAK